MRSFISTTAPWVHSTDVSRSKSANLEVASQLRGFTDYYVEEDAAKVGNFRYFDFFIVQHTGKDPKGVIIKGPARLRLCVSRP